MFLDFIIRAFLNIQYQASSVGPENATVSNIPAMPVETILCNVRVNPGSFTTSHTARRAAKLCARVVPRLWLPRNRMTELVTSGSVGGAAGKPPLLPGPDDQPLLHGGPLHGDSNGLSLVLDVKVIRYGYALKSRFLWLESITNRRY